MKKEKTMKLKFWLDLYKRSLGKEKLEVSQEERVKVEEGQIRIFLWSPWEYVLVGERVEEGLFECYPLTLLLELTTTSIRIKHKNKTYAPLPFHVYIREEILENESILEGKIPTQWLEDVKKSVEWATLNPYNRYKREFIKLVWERFKDLSLSSVIYTHIKREQEEPAGVVIALSDHLSQKLIEKLGAYSLAAKGTKYLKGSGWYGVVEEDKLTIYLPQDVLGKSIRIRFMEEVVYEGVGQEKVVLENLPTLPDYEPLEGLIDVEIQD
ncbi:hypothetical protein [Thermocrinis sp.]